MVKVILKVYFDEDISLTPESAKKEVLGKIKRASDDFEIVETGKYPMVLDTQDTLVTVLLDVHNSGDQPDNSVQYTKRIFTPILQSGTGAIAHHIKAHEHR